MAEQFDPLGDAELLGAVYDSELAIVPAPDTEEITVEGVGSHDAGEGADDIVEVLVWLRVADEQQVWLVNVVSGEDSVELSGIESVSECIGHAGVDDFGLTIGGVSVTSGQVTTQPPDAPITIDEIGLEGYDFVEITGDTKCPSVLHV